MRSRWRRPSRRSPAASACRSIYKTSFDKANRTSSKGARGMGLDSSLPVFAEIRERLGLPTLTDIHEIDQCARVGARSSTSCRSPPSCAARPTSCRGGADGTRRQRQEGPVPGALGHEERRRQDHRRRQPQRAGDRARRLLRLQHAGVRHARSADHGRDAPAPRWCSTRPIPSSSRAGRAPRRAGSASSCRCWRARLWRSGVAAVFIETHQDPDNAPSDGPNMVPLSELEALLQRLTEFDRIAKAA